MFTIMANYNFEKGFIRTDRGLFVDKGNYAVDPRHPDFAGGALGDGARDDRAAIAAADEFAAANGMGLVFGPGNYRIGSALTLSAATIEMKPGAVFDLVAALTISLASSVVVQHKEAWYDLDPDTTGSDVGSIVMTGGFQRGVSSPVLVTEDGGSVNAYSATVYPPIPPNAKWTTVIVRLSLANTTSTPTFQLNGWDAKTIVRETNQPLAVFDIRGSDGQYPGGSRYFAILSYDNVSDAWVLLNPSVGHVHGETVTFTFDTSLLDPTTGLYDQAVVMSFRPSMLLLLGRHLTDTGIASTGWAGSNDNVSISAQHSALARIGTGGWVTQLGSVWIQENAGTALLGQVDNYTATGFNIAWEKVAGTPSGTVQVRAIGIR